MTGSIPALALVPRFDSEDVRLVAYSLAGRTSQQGGDQRQRVRYVGRWLRRYGAAPESPHSATRTRSETKPSVLGGDGHQTAPT